VLSYQPIINELDIISLISVDVTKMKITEDQAKILLNPLKMKSAYSQNLKNIIEILNGKCETEILLKLISSKDLENIDVYGIKITKDRLDSTLNFLKDLTHEPPLTFFAKNTMVNVDFIFYEGNMHVLRTLNTPDVNTLLDMKSLPNHIYPSDHISLTADFILY
jgi:mRNA deadenylase 3'-5' endonuclease subunit Ccr4